MLVVIKGLEGYKMASDKTKIKHLILELLSRIMPSSNLMKGNIKFILAG